MRIVVEFQSKNSWKFLFSLNVVLNDNFLLVLVLTFSLPNFDSMMQKRRDLQAWKGIANVGKLMLVIPNGYCFYKKM